MKRTFEQTKETPAEQLARLGYTTIPGVSDCAHHRSAIDAAIAAFPEYLDTTRLKVLGGFSALGNPASFHNQAVRDLRALCYPKALEALGPLKREGDKFEMDIDRVMLRPAGVSPSPESWHRDEAMNGLDSDVIFGGWVNLDSASQYFNCVPATHTGVKGNRGFAPISKELAKTLAPRKRSVEIPSGHILIFNEKLVHEVRANKASHDSYRLFLGWRITTSDQPLDPALLTKLQKQSAMSLKSGQESAMYAKLHWCNWRPKLVAFSSCFKKQCTSVREVGSGAAKGEKLRVVHQNMLSLEEYGFDKYPPYTQAEIAQLLPH